MNDYMEYYRDTYKHSPYWDGKTPGKLIVYQQQGYGDQIMFLRFLRYVNKRGCEIILHAPKAMERLVKTMDVQFHDKEDFNLPDHDFHALSLDLPFLMKCAIPLDPYIFVREKFDLPEGLNVGICWTGNSFQCPLKYFSKLKGNLISLIPVEEVSEDINLLGVEINDFYDVAKLINSVDYVVSIDTAAMHLAGAMGKNGYGLLSDRADSRWEYVWYPSIKMIKQDWEKAISTVVLHES